MNLYLKLFISFAKIGAMTFGGGYAMLPMLTRICVTEKDWVTEEELMDYYAIGQCTPGVIAVNTATFIGIKQKGTLGGIVATLGVIFPSVVIIMIIASFINNFSENIMMQNALSGVRIAVCGLVTVSVYKLFKKSAVDIFTVIIAVLSFITVVIFSLSPVIVVITAALSGILVNILKQKLNGSKNKN